MHQRMSPEPGDIFRVELEERAETGTVTKTSRMLTHAASKEEIGDQVTWYLREAAFTSSPDFKDVTVKISKIEQAVPLGDGNIETPRHAVMN